VKDLQTPTCLNSGTCIIPIRYEETLHV